MNNGIFLKGLYRRFSLPQYMHLKEKRKEALQVLPQICIIEKARYRSLYYIQAEAVRSITGSHLIQLIYLICIRSILKFCFVEQGKTSSPQGFPVTMNFKVKGGGEGGEAKEMLRVIVLENLGIILSKTMSNMKYRTGFLTSD